MSGLGNGLVQLFKAGRKYIGNKVDNFLLDADARKAISDEVINRYKPKIDLAHRAESRRATNIKDLGDKLNQSKEELANAQKAWQDKYNAELASAKNQRQADIDNYNTQLKTYNDAVDTATKNKESIVGQLFGQEANYDPYKTLYTDVMTGHRYLLNRYTHDYEDLSWIYPTLTPKQQRALQDATKDFGERLIDSSNKNNIRVINAFDKNDAYNYGGNDIFDEYVKRAQAPQYSALRDADNNITRARDDLTAWQNQGQPADWDDNVHLKQFETDFKSNNGVKPNKYSFNGQDYKSAKDLDAAYKDAVAHEQKIQSLDSRGASRYASARDAEIAKRIQDAKDIKKAKLALGAGAGIGALYAGARAMYGGDDTDNIDNTDNINNIDNTDYGKPDSHFNVEKEGQAILKDRQQSDPDINVDTDFDPDKAAAVLASGAYDTGVEDGNSIRSSDDLGNLIGATTGGHTMEDRLYELIKAMKDPYKADAVANYIYSRHGDDPEVQNLGWRGWLNKYYGDSLRSIMNRDPSGYKGMHISGGL